MTTMAMAIFNPISLIITKKLARQGIRLGALGPVTREELSLAGLSSTMSETTRVSSMVLMLARAIGEGT